MILKENKMTSKTKYKITVNWYGELMTFWRYAKTPRQAMSLTCIEMGKILGRETAAIRRYYSQGKDNYKVKEVVK